jgi:Flp pilus assembly protein TadG
MKLARSFSTSSKGTSAVEFALGAPILAIVVLGVATGWALGGQVFEMRNSVKVGANYFIQGGTDLDVAKNAAMAAWENRPDDGEVEVTRQCTCGDALAACTEIFTATSAAPNMSVRITAISTAQAPILSFVYSEVPSITQEEVVRVR